VSYDNSRIASVGGDKHVLLWDVANARVIRRWEGHSGRCNAVVWGGQEEGGDGVVISGKSSLLRFDVAWTLTIV
jgi:WD40 repeat protein